MDALHPEIDIILKVALALLLGLVTGIEREMVHKPAGMRTHMLLAGGAALLTSLAIQMVIFFEQTLPGSNLQFDPIRVIEATVVGVSFLGAGTILKMESQHKVENLTTAAGLFVTAGIGIAVALGNYYLAIGVSVLIVIVEHMFLNVRDWVDRKSPRLKR